MLCSFTPVIISCTAE